MVVVLNLKDFHQLRGGRPLLHVLEDLGTGLGQSRIQAGSVVIAALGQQLHGLGVVPGLDHPVHPLPGEEPVFHGPDPGRDG